MTVWDAIEELEQAVDKDSYQGDMILIFLDEANRYDMKMMSILERRFAAAPGGRDLRFAFAFKAEHAAHHTRWNVTDTPAAIFVRESVEMERTDSADDVMELVNETIAKYK